MPADRFTMAIRGCGIAVAYGSTLALAPSDVTVPAGVVAAVIGPNGSGKTTLLNAITGLAELSAGHLEVFGEPPGVDVRRIAYVLQSTRVNEFLPITVLEAVRMGRYSHRGLVGRFREEDHHAVLSAMDRLEITELARRHLDLLSGGQRQWVFVAQGLAQGAPLLLLDEPTTALDVVSRERIARAIAAERERGTTVVLTTHDLAEARAADWVIVVAGRVLAAGPPGEVCTPDILGHAYGARFVVTDHGSVLVDDAHHATQRPRSAQSPPRSPGRAIVTIRVVSCLGIAVLATLFVGCAGNGQQSSLPLVIATTSVLGDVATEVVADAGRVETLIPRGTDPHEYQASAAQTARVRQADLVVANGLGLEEGLANVLDAAAAANVPVLELAPRLDPVSNDPHFWLDPLRMADGALLIGQELAAHAAEDGWTDRAQSYAIHLESIHDDIEQTLASVPPDRRLLVTDHDSFRYFAERYEFSILGTLVPGTSPLAAPTAQHIAELAALIRADDVPAIFLDVASTDTVAEGAARGTGSTGRERGLA